jgi:hypothetical protein
MPVNDRISCLHVRKNLFTCSIINIHAPIEEKTEEENKAFYEALEKTYDESPMGNIKIVLADMNTQTGKEDIYIPTTVKVCSQSNDNELRLINFAASRQMVMGNTIFCHKNMHKATWNSLDGQTMNQTYHILIDMRYKSNLMEVKAVREANTDYDHFSVVSKLHSKISNCKKEHGTMAKEYNTNILKTAI